MLTIVQNSTEADFEDFGVYKPPWVFSAHLQSFIRIHSKISCLQTENMPHMHTNTTKNQTSLGS